MIPFRIATASRISCAARRAFAGELLSKEYTKIFVSRKNLPLIHLIPAKAAPCINVPQTLHQRIHFLRATGLTCKLDQPFAKGSIESLTLRTRSESRLFNKFFIRT